MPAVRPLAYPARCERSQESVDRDHHRSYGLKRHDPGVDRHNNHKASFRWDIFNLTNTAKFNIGDLTATPDRVSTFGAYNSSLTTCDGGAGRCMQFMVRYEF